MRGRVEGEVEMRVEANVERRRRGEIESEMRRDRLVVDLWGRRDIDRVVDHPVRGRPDDRHGDRPRHGETGERLVYQER